MPTISDYLFYEKNDRPRRAAVRRLNEDFVRQQGDCLLSTRACGDRSGRSDRPRIQVSLWVRDKSDEWVWRKKSLDVHKLVMIHKRVESGERNPPESGLTVSHLCHNKKCITSDHLVLETMAENNQRNLCVLQGHCSEDHSNEIRCII